MMERCPWCLGNEKMIRYHDEEWGVPVHDDQKQFEFLMMEVMQCGLNWKNVKFFEPALTTSISIK